MNTDTSRCSVSQFVTSATIRFPLTTKVLVDSNDIRSYGVDVGGSLTLGSVAGMAETNDSAIIDSATSDRTRNWLV